MMKKSKVMRMMLAVILVSAMMLAGCGSSAAETTTAAPETTKEETTAEAAQTETPAESEAAAKIRVGGLKGATSIGLVGMMDNDKYEFIMETAADAMLAHVLKGEVDIALIPANAAANLYQKTNKGISVIDINTLSVLYFAENGNTIKNLSDLSGKTIYLTGKGTTPDYVMQYLIEEAGLTNVTLEFKSEASEVAAVLASEAGAVGLLPQPFVTAAQAKNEALNVVLSVNDEWNRFGGAGKQVTGVTIVRNEFLQENPEAVAAFLADHKASAEYVNANAEAAGEKVAELGIVASAAIAAKAIPQCAISCITGEEMQTALTGYLEVLYVLNPASIGGELPEASFYYTAE